MNKNLTSLLAVTLSFLTACSNLPQNGSELADDERIDGVLMRNSLGHGIKVSRGQPAQGVCVAQASASLNLLGDGEPVAEGDFLPEGQPATENQPTGEEQQPVGEEQPTGEQQPAGDEQPSSDQPVAEQSIPDGNDYPAQSPFDGNDQLKDIAFGDVSEDETVLARFESGSQGGETAFALNEGGGVTGEVILITSESEASRATEVSAQISGSTPYVSGGVSSTVRREMSNTSQKSYLLFRLQYRGRYEHISSPTLTALGRGGAGSFYDRCGDRYIKAKQFGGLFYGIAEMNRVEESNRQNVTATVTNLSTRWTPGVTGGGSFSLTTAERNTLGITRVQLHREGGADGNWPTSIEGLIAAAQSFATTVNANQALVVGYLKDYRGLASDTDAQTGDTAEQATAALQTAAENLRRANDQISRIDGYPAYQRSNLRTQRSTLSTYVSTLEAAMQTCRSDNSRCDLAALRAAVPSVSLPEQVNISATWTANRAYAVPVHNTDVFCNFAQYRRNARPYSAISQVDVIFTSTDPSEMARIRVQEFFDWAPDWASYYHEVPIHSLAPYLPSIIAGRMSNTMIARMVTEHLAPLTSRDGNYAFTDCYAR